MTPPVHCALWLLPDASCDSCLRALMRSAGPNGEAPRFTPHLTLLGGLHLPPERARRRFGAARPELRAVSVRLERFDHGEAYFRCLVLRVAPLAALHEMHRRVARVFGCTPAMGFAPHVSLLYGMLPVAERLRRIAQLQRQTLPAACRMHSAALVDVTGPVERWTVLAAYDLGD